MILKYSKDAKIDFEARDNKGRTPLHDLFQSFPKKTVEHFLKSAKDKYNIEFDLTAKDKSGLTPPQMKCWPEEEDEIVNQ